jgi:type IV pilus assembly protein PilM
MTIATTRPELACEIVPEGVIAARREPDSGLLASAAFSAFGPHAPAAVFAPYIDKDAPRVGLPGLQTGDPRHRDIVVQALKRALESVGGRNGVVTLVVPDTAVRVLLMDFDSLPSKKAEAIPLLRFRLKKLVAFDVEDTAISYQTVPSATGVRLLVAVSPGPVMKEYEAIVREAGFEPGIVLTSSLACLGMIPDDAPAMIVYASTQSVTTAITRGQELLLHRTQELPWQPEQLAETAVGGNFTEVASVTSDPESVVGVVAEGLGFAETPAVLELQADAPVTEGAPAAHSYLHDSADPIELELQHAVTVAAAFYEDAIGSPVRPVLVSGAMDARTWHTLLGHDEIALRDLVSAEDMGTATESGLSRAQLGAVCGALRS